MDQLPKIPPPDHLRSSHPDDPEAELDLGAVFYRQIAPTKILPQWHRVPDPIDATVTGMNTLSINGNILDLRGHRLFIFNGLMYLRYLHRKSRSPLLRRGLAASEIKELGFTGSRTTAWRRNIQTLAQELHDVAGEEILFITGDGRGTRYAINERFRLLEHEDDPEAAVWYEFARALSAGLPHLTHTIEFGPQDAPLLEMVIRDDDTVVCNSNGLQLNQHERAFLGMLLLQQGEYLESTEAKALGFHAYAKSEHGKTKALERTVKAINDKIVLPIPFIRQEKIGQYAIYSIGPRLRLIDVRQGAPAETSFAEMSTIMSLLFDRLDESPFTPQDERLSHDQIKSLLPNYLDVLTTPQAYALSLKYKIILEPLINTQVVHRNGSITRYEDLIEHILSETPNTRARVAQLLGIANGSRMAIMAIANIHKAIRSGRTSA